MTDEQLITKVFPKRVVKAVNREIGRETQGDSGDSPPTEDKDTE